MMKSKFTADQVEAILKQAESGSPVMKLCEEHRISHVTFYRWRRKAKTAGTASIDAVQTPATNPESAVAAAG